jgi:hypothetical protein
MLTDGADDVGRNARRWHKVRRIVDLFFVCYNGNVFKENVVAGAEGTESEQSLRQQIAEPVV